MNATAHEHEHEFTKDLPCELTGCYTKGCACGAELFITTDQDGTVTQEVFEAEPEDCPRCGRPIGKDLDGIPCPDCLLEPYCHACRWPDEVENDQS